MIFSGWKRFIVVLAGVFFFLFVNALICVFIYNQLLHSPFWAIRNIYINGNKVLSDKQILDAAQIPKGTVIWAFKLADIQERLEKLAWVERARIRWNFPDSLYIEIFEKIPFIVVCSEGECYYVDKYGVLFERCDNCGYSRFKLMVENIKSVTENVGSLVILRSGFKDDIVKLLKAVAEIDGIYATKSTRKIEYNRKEGFSIHIDSFRVILGENDFDLKLRLLTKISEILEKLKKIVDFDSIDLRYRHYVLVKQGFSGKE